MSTSDHSIKIPVVVGVFSAAQRANVSPLSQHIVNTCVTLALDLSGYASSRLRLDIAVL